MKVPFVDLTVVTRQVKADYLSAVGTLLDKNHFILTEEVAAFEQQWAATIGMKYCVAVSNGADALYLALVACGVGAGDEVITQGNAYNASVTAIMRTGAVPRFADIKADTLTIDVSRIEPLINEKTKAILPVHLYGQPNNLAAINTIAQKHQLKVIEDCAQAHLATYEGTMAGGWGDANAFSFYPTKNLGAFGDAGAVTTNDEKIYREILARRDLGQVQKNDHHYFGANMRCDPVQAIALTLKLAHLRANTQARQAAALRYDELIAQAAGTSVTPVGRLPKAEHVYHLYVVQISGFERGAVMAALAEQGIQTAIHYPTVVYQQPFYHGPKDPCPVAEAAAKKILSLPLFVGITAEQQQYVVDALAAAVRT